MPSNGAGSPAFIQWALILASCTTTLEQAARNRLPKYIPKIISSFLVVTVLHLLGQFVSTPSLSGPLQSLDGGVDDRNDFSYHST